jgi:hypothetical protein
MKKTTNTNPLSAKNITFFNACRENTGAHMLDSGGAYGRIYDQPPIPEDAPVIRNWEAGCPATICTAAFLNQFYTIDRELQAKWEKWDAKQKDLNWWESGAHYAEHVLGLCQEARDNLCNQQNDFDQVFVYEVYNKEPSSDWVYPEDDTVVILYIHTGCDVRGGYGRPLFCRVKDSHGYTVPVDCCAGYGAYDCGERLEEAEQWGPRDSSYPYGALEASVAAWHEDTRTRDSVEVTLHSGKHVKVTAYADASN